MTALGFLCRLDQWGARPGNKIPPELLRDLRRSSMLVMIGSAASGRSTAMETEIREFLPTKLFVMPWISTGLSAQQHGGPYSRDLR